MWESYVQAYSNPCCSASCISSIIRWYGGSGRTVTPKLSIEPPRSLGRETSITPVKYLRLPHSQAWQLRRAHGERGQRPECCDRCKADAPVPRERERHADER